LLRLSAGRAEKKRERIDSLAKSIFTFIASNIRLQLEETLTKQNQQTITKPHAPQLAFRWQSCCDVALARAPLNPQAWDHLVFEEH
jgi:hypothetical protein